MVLRCLSNGLPIADILSYLVGAVTGWGQWEGDSMSKRTFEKLMLDSRRAIAEKLTSEQLAMEHVVFDESVTFFQRIWIIGWSHACEMQFL